MKKKFASLLFLLFPFLLSAQEPAFVWAKGMGSNGEDFGNSIAVDAAGNVYTTGWFEGTVDFDPGPGTFNLTSAGERDIFISKLDASGNFVWAKGMGGSEFDEGNSIAVDAAGNVYTTGWFSGKVDFDPGPGTFNMTAPSGADAFISKLDGNGDFLWAKGMGGTGTSIAVDPAGNVYTTGYFDGTADFDPGPGTFNLTSAGDNDVFVLKLNANSNFVWAKNMGGNDFDLGLSIAVDMGGDVYTTGVFRGTADFDPGPGMFNLTSAGDLDIYISKLDATGNLVWAKGMGGSGVDFGNSIAVDAAGNVYTTGSFAGTVDFDPGPATSFLTSAGDFDVFILKVDAAGNLVWIKRIGGGGPDQGNSIAVDVAGNVYTTGWFNGTVDFDPGPATFNLTTEEDFDAFISKLDGNGDFLWAKGMGGSGYAEGRSIALDAGKNVYTTGIFFGSVDFDPGPGTVNLTAVGKRDIFVLQLAQQPCTPPTFLNDLTIVLDASQCGGDGNISIIPLTGTAPFLYSLDGGATYVSGPNSGYTFQGLAAGTYQLRLKDASGCESVVVTREVRTVFPCNKCINKPTFLNNGQIVLDASCNGRDGAIFIIPTSGTAPFHYSIDGGATYVNGPNSGYGFQNLPAGTYQLRLKDANGCESAVVTRVIRANVFGNCLTATNPRLGNLSKDAAQASIYPNPSHGQFQVKHSGHSGRVQVEVVDSRGSTVLQKQVNTAESNVVDVNLSEKAKGLYLVKLISDKGIQTIKVIVQ